MWGQGDGQHCSDVELWNSCCTEREQEPRENFGLGGNEHKGMKAEGQEADDRNLWSEIQTLELLSQVIEQ